MLKQISLVIVLFLISSCVLQSQQNVSKSTTEVKKEVVVETIPEPPKQPVVVSCLDDKSLDIGMKSKVVVTYDNDQKESFADTCLERDEPAFKSFKQRYYCDGLLVKSKLYNCFSKNNMTCVKGECI